MTGVSTGESTKTFWVLSKNRVLEGSIKKLTDGKYKKTMLLNILGRKKGKKCIADSQGKQIVCSLYVNSHSDTTLKLLSPLLHKSITHALGLEVIANLLFL